MNHPFDTAGDRHQFATGAGSGYLTGEGHHPLFDSHIDVINLVDGREYRFQSLAYRLVAGHVGHLDGRRVVRGFLGSGHAAEAAREPDKRSKKKQRKTANHEYSLTRVAA